MTQNATKTLPALVGSIGGAISQSKDDFAERVCTCLAYHCPHIRHIEKINGSIVATDTSGKVVFTCPLPQTMLDWDPVTCTIVYVDTNNQQSVIDLTQVLQKAEDALSFSAVDCVLSYRPVAPGSAIETHDLSVILNKLKDRLSFDPVTCDLSLLDSNAAVIGSWPLGAIMNKHPELVAALGENCDLVIEHGDDIATVDLAPIMEKIGVDWDPVTCELKIAIPGLVDRCYTIPVAQVLAKAQDYLTWNEQTCVFRHSDVNGNDQVIDVGAAILAKIQSGIVFDADTCILQMLGATGAIENSYDIGAAIVAKLQDENAWDPETCKLTLVDTAGQSICIDLTVLLDKLEIDMSYDEELCQIKFQVLGQPAQCFDIGSAILDKIVFPDETVTTLIEGQVDAAGNSSFTYTNESGDPVTVTFCKRCPTVSAGSDNVTVTPVVGVNGQVDYTVEVDEVVTTLVDNGNGSLTYTNENGDPVTIEFCEVCPEVVAGGANVEITTSVGDNGQTIYTVEVTETDETVTTLIEGQPDANGNSSFTYMNENGDPVTVTFCKRCPTVAASGDNVTVTATVGENGQTEYVVEVDETVTTLTNNNDGSFTYTNENGDPVTVEFCAVCPDVVAGSDNVEVTTSIGANGQTVYNVSVTAEAETITSLVDNGPGENGSGSFTYTNEAGDPVTITYCANCPVVVGGGDVTVTAAVVDGVPVYSVNFVETVTSLQPDPENGLLTYTDEDGNPTDIDVCVLIAKCLPKTTSTDDTVTVNVSTGPDGETVYDLSVNVPSFQTKNNGSLEPLADGAVVLTLDSFSAQTGTPATIFGQSALGECVAVPWVEKCVVSTNVPSKSLGAQIWINPETCEVRFCNDAGQWFKPNNVICTEQEPRPGKDGYEMWYQPSTCCFSIACDEVWVQVNGVAEAAQGQLVNCAGEKLEANDQVVTPSDVQCEQGCVKICDTEFAIARDAGRIIWSAANLVVFDSADELSVGDVIESPVCGTFTTPDCLAAEAKVTLSVVLEFNHRDHTSGLVAVQNQVSIDNGVTWVAVGLGGYVLGPPNLNNQTDNENGGIVSIPIDPGTTYVVKQRAVLAIATSTFDGVVTLNQFETDWFFDYISCNVERAA